MPDKRATTVADRILADVRAAGWPVGTVLGGEAELVRHYNVSRAVYREAVRLVEHRGVVVTRRGPGGGLVVTEPSMAAVSEAVVTYLLYRQVTIREVFELRAVVESAAAEHAARRSTDEARTRLIGQAASERHLSGASGRSARHLALHAQIAEASQNPAMELIILVLARLSALFLPVGTDPAVSHVAVDASATSHERIAGAIAGGDPVAAHHLMRAHIASMEDWMLRHASVSTASLAVPGAFEPGKLGERVAHLVLGEILDAGWPVGAVLGSEHDLAKRFGVSRNVLREATRLLEFHRVATMRRGPGGGLVVTAPDIRPVIAAARAYIEYRQISPAQLTEVWAPIQRDAVARCAREARPDDVAVLRGVLEDGHRAEFRGPARNSFDVAVAEASGNRVAAMFVQLLANVTLHRIPAVSPDVGAQYADDAYRARLRIVDAIAGNDVDAAVRRTERFLGALQAFVH
jgi:DNA-binding FadR family transcriptional regulator